MPVGKYFTFRYPITILFLIRKYLTHICFSLLPLDNIPLFLRSMALMLSWYMSASSKSNPGVSINHPNHSNSESTPSDLISSASVELLEFIFFLLDMLDTNPHPRNIVAPLWLQQSGCISYYLSTHYFTMLILYPLNINGM